MIFKLLNWLKAADKSEVRIGIEGLSESAAVLSEASLHAVAVPDERASRLLISNTALGAIQAGCRVTVASADPAACADSLRAVGVTLETASLRLLKLLPDALSQLELFGCSRFLTELEDTGVGSGNLLLLENADNLFDWSDIRQARSQLRSYQKWFSDWQITGVFFFNHKTSGQLDDIFGKLADDFSGLAELRQDLGYYRWLIRHWYSVHGITEAQEYEVHSAADGLGLVALLASSDFDGIKDDGLVYVTADALDDDEAFPDGWMLCRDYADLLSFAAELRAATVVLHYRQQQEFPQLAQTVHKLRFSAGRRIKIVIREKGQQLRYSQELLLARLGANQVVYREFGMSRLFWSVESLREQRFAGHIEENFDTALASAIPSEECGYLPPAKFCELVRSTLHKTESMDMHHVMVRLGMVPEKAHLDVLLSCQPKRSNDIITADESHIFIFLYACRESDIEAALSRIIIAPLDQLFIGQTHWAGRRNILNAVDDLLEKSQLKSLADFSLVLPRLERQVFSVTTSVAESLEKPVIKTLPQANSEAAEPKAVPAVRTVIRHALKLRA